MATKEDNVIVIDDSGDEGEVNPDEQPSAPLPSASKMDDDDDDVVLVEPSEVSKSPRLTPTSSVFSKEVTISKVKDVNSDLPIVEPIDFARLRQIVELSSESHGKIKKGRGPVCCNSWCGKPATLVPEDHIRDYYNIPTGSAFKLCNGCVNDYYAFIEKAEKNLESNGDMLEGRCVHFNEFIVLEDDSDEEDEVIDQEMEKLLGKVFEEGLKALDAEYNFKKTFECTKAKVVEKLERFVIDGSKLAERINTMEKDLFKASEEFKNEFKPRVLELAELNPPYENHVVPPSTSEKLNFSEADSLPPFGEFSYPKPKVGETFYVLKDFNSGEWVPFKITDIAYESNEAGNLVENYTVEATINGFFYRRIVSGDNIAYYKAPQYRLGIGSRVVGVSNENGDAPEKRTFLSGMIAELPTPLNNHRYLVFFENGKVQYCIHEDLRLVYQCSKKNHEYFSGFHIEFVQSYLKKFPERAMVKTIPDHFVRVELNGFWISGKVDLIDCSLARFTFGNEQRREWIYRGSPRLRPVFEKIQSDLRNPLTKALPIIKSLPPRTMGPKSKMNHNRDLSNLQIVIESSDDEDEGHKQVRAVAKKSTSRTIQQMNGPHYTQLVNRRQEKRGSRNSVIRRMPPLMFSPNPFRWHKCSFACVTWVQYSEEKTKGINPLAIPSIFAFKREIDVTSAVTYTGPCGKKLKNIQEVLKYLSETLIPLTLDMFDFDIRTQIFDEFVVSPQFILMEDISYGEERNPIPCVNEVDNLSPDLMSYMTERRPMEGVNINLDPGFLVCCDCTDNCRDRSKCRCWRLTIDNYRPFNIGDNKRHITKIGYQYQRLDQNILSGIYECNSQCHCNKVTCINRVVQHKTRHKLQLFKTARKGWGTRCVNDIPQGVFISTYVGNILTEPKANETGTINGDEYFAELDHIEVMQQNKADYEAEAAKMTDDDDDEDSAEEAPVAIQRPSKRALRSCTLKKWATPAPPPKPADPPHSSESDSDSDSEVDSVRKYYGPNETVYVMDAKIAGNIGRYFNHSCDPNIFVQNVYVDTHDLRFPWVAFFALRHIPAGTELTWDYGYRIGSVPGKVLYCYCGAPNCRKRLL